MPAFKVEWAYLLAGANGPKNTWSLWCLNWIGNSLWNRPWSRAGSRFRPCGGRCCPWVLGVTCVLLETQEKQPNKSVHGWLCEVFNCFGKDLFMRILWAKAHVSSLVMTLCWESFWILARTIFFAFPMLATFGQMWRSKKQGLFRFGITFRSKNLVSHHSPQNSV